MRNVILGDGILGGYLHSQTRWDYVSRKKDGIDFKDLGSYKNFLEGYDQVINCIANTETYSKEGGDHWKVNYEGVSSLVDYCSLHSKKIVHFSSDFVYSNSVENASEEDVPVHCNTWYGYTKLLGEGYVILKSNNYLVLRGTHKKSPFEHGKAYVNRVGNFDYLEVMGELFIQLIERGATGIFNVGTEVKSMYDLALRTNPEVLPTQYMIDPSAPHNLSMDISKMKKFLSET